MSRSEINRALYPKSTPENDVKKACLDLLAAYRIPAWHRNTGAHSAEHTNRAGQTKRRFIRYSAPGQSDIWGIDPASGRHIEIEVKRKGERPTDAQVDWLADVARFGGIALWADSPEMLMEKLKSGGLI